MKTQIPWLRVFVEGVVIVGSILLAFGTPVSGQDAPQPDRIELALSDPAFDWHELETENFRVCYLIQALTPRMPSTPGGTWRTRSNTTWDCSKSNMILTRFGRS